MSIKNNNMKAYPLPERIKEARLAHGYTQIEMAELLGVTRQAICQYESGSSHPKPEVIGLLQDLGFPLDYFYKDVAYQINTPIFFRSFKTAEKREREMLRVRIRWMVEIYFYLKSFFDFAELKLIRKEQEFYSQEEIEKIALELRKLWGLGLGPISNVNLLLENNGIILSKISLGKRKVDACSIVNTSQYEFRPLICLTADKSSAVRSRFDAAHELGHFVLHSWVDEEYLSVKENQDRIEKEAHSFAGAFLLPLETFSHEAYSLTSIDSFINLKRRWKVSIAAMIRRCYDNNLINKSQYEYLQRQMSVRRYRATEPLDDVLPDEQPQVLRKAIEMLIEHEVQSPEEIRESIKLPIEQLEMLLAIDKQLLRKKQEPHLKLVK